MAFLGDLLIRMRADTADFQSDMGKAAYMAEKSMRQIKNAANLAFGGLSVAAIGYYAKSLVDAAEQMDKMAQRTGIAVGKLSELKFAASLGEVEFGALAKSIGFFNVQTVQASDKTSKQAKMFKELGVDLTKGPNAALMQFAERASSIEDAAVKTTVFRAAFGKVGDELIPVMKNLKETTDQAKRLGITMDEETSQAAARLNDNLKALKAQTDAFTTKKMDGIIGAFATISDNITKAAEKGEKWLQVMKEIIKVNLAFASKIPGPIGGLAGALADRAFAEGGSRSASGKIGGLGGAPPNSKALAKILSDSSAKKIDKYMTAEDIARRQAEAGEYWASEKEKLWEFIHSLDVKGYAEEKKLDDKALEDLQAGMLARFDAAQEYADQMTAVIGGRIKQTNDIAKELGLTFSSAFESAILEGNKFRDVLQGILKDILRIIARKTITEPMAAGITGLLGGFNFASLFGGDAASSWVSGESLALGAVGGGRAMGGPVSGGASYLVGERGPEIFTPGISGNITSNSNIGGTNLNFAPVIRIDSRTDSATIARTVEGALRQSEARLVEQVNRASGPMYNAVRRV